MIRESWQHRKDLEGIYDTEIHEGTPIVWTADLKMLQALHYLFDFSVAILLELKLLHGKLTRAEPNPFDDTDPSQLLLSQLGDLVRFIFSCTSQRLNWLEW